MSDGPISASMPRPVTSGFMALYTFIQYAHWLAVLTPVTITIALRIGQIASPGQKAASLATIMAVGAFSAMAAAPVWGAISDQTTARMGRRKVWIVAGSLFLLAGLAIMAFTQQIWLLGLGWFICQVGSNASQAALGAIMPDQVPIEQRGRMSSFLGLTTVFALVSGTFITQFTHQNSIAMFLVPWIPYLVAVLLVLRFLPDAPSQSTEGISITTVFSAFRVNPFRDRDFGLAFSCRFLFMTSNSFAQTYQVFMLMDVIGLASGQVPGAMFTITAAVAVLGTVLSPLAGTLVDKTGRMKPLVMGAGLVATAGFLAISQTRTLSSFIAAMVVLGVGKSIIYALTTALAATVLPDKGSAAKDMGIIQIANSLPQSLAPALGPLLLMIGGGQSNYEALFIAAALFAVGGTLSIIPIRRIR